MNTQGGVNRIGQRPLAVLAAAILLALAAPVAVAQEQQEEESSFSLDDEPALTEETAKEPDPDLKVQRNWVEIGVGYVSDSSFKFGKYTGLENEGLYGVLSFDVGGRAPWDGEIASWWRATGSDLGLNSRELGVEGGVQGKYRVYASYDEIPTYRSDSASTIYNGAGPDGILRLPGNWVPAQNTAGMTQLNNSLDPVDLEQLRRRFDLGFDGTVREHWDFGTSWRHEDRNGNKSFGAVIGNSGGNPRAVLVAEPIDYSSDDFDAVVSFRDPKKQFSLAYHASLFDNNQGSFGWENAYSAINGWTPAAGFPTGDGQASTPPENQFHQVSGAGGWSFAGNMRLDGDLAFGRMTQDDTYLPYTVNPVLAATITQPLPRSSLDGRIDTTVGNLRLSGRPTDQLRWDASVRYDDRDNQTPRDEYVYIGGDSLAQNTGVTSSFRRFNEPMSYKETKYRGDVGYRFADWLDASLVGEYRDIERTYSEREEAEETNWSLFLRSNPWDSFEASLQLTAASRDGSTYVGNEPFLSGYSPGYTSTVPGGWENAPGLRKYHLADRDRQQAILHMGYMPTEAWVFGLNVNYIDDDYDSSELGLTNSIASDYTLDIAYAPGQNWSAYGFYTYERMDADQDGRSIRGAATRVADAEDPNRSWFADQRDDVLTWGLGLETRWFEDQLELNFDYLESDSESDMYVTAGTALTYAPLPTLETDLSSLGVNATWRWNKDISLRGGYWLQQYDSTDWALDGVEANQLANVILFGEESPDYNVHVVTFSVVVNF